MASVSDRNTDARGKPGTERTEKNFLPLQPIVPCQIVLGILETGK